MDYNDLLKDLNSNIKLDVLNSNKKLENVIDDILFFEMKSNGDCIIIKFLGNEIYNNFLNIEQEYNELRSSLLKEAKKILKIVKKIFFTV